MANIDPKLVIAIKALQRQIEQLSGERMTMRKASKLIAELQKSPIITITIKRKGKVTIRT